MAKDETSRSGNGGGGKKEPDNPASAPAIHEADDGGDSRLTKGYEKNPDAPEGSVAQIEVLKDE